MHTGCVHWMAHVSEIIYCGQVTMSECKGHGWSKGSGEAPQRRRWEGHEEGRQVTEALQGRQDGGSCQMQEKRSNSEPQLHMAAILKSKIAI